MDVLSRSCADGPSPTSKLRDPPPASTCDLRPTRSSSTSMGTAIRHALTNRNYNNEILPISDKALANLEALQQIDGLHDYGSYYRNECMPWSVWERVRSWLDFDDWGPERRTGQGLPVPGWRSRCLEQHPAPALHIAVNSGRGRSLASYAGGALDAGRSIEEAVRIARFDIPADTDPRRLRVHKAGKKGRWRIEVAALHPSMRNEKKLKPSKKVRAAT